MKNQKGSAVVWVLILVVVLVVVGVSSIYYFTNKNSSINTVATSTVSTTTITTGHPIAGAGEHCGGNMTTAPICVGGYECVPTPGSHLPFGDVGGTCVKDQTGTLSGSVTLSPTCPVEKNPPDPQCAPKAYPTEVKVLSTDGATLIMQMQSLANGAFIFSLPPGNYELSASGGSPYPRCSSVVVEVNAGSTTVEDISCDTGIR